MMQPDSLQLQFTKHFRDQNFKKRKVDCIEDKEDAEFGGGKKFVTERKVINVPHELKRLEVAVQRIDTSNYLVKSDPCNNRNNNDAKDRKKNKPANQNQTEKRVSVEQVNALVQKLGWTGKVQQVCLGKNKPQNFAVCHTCETLIVGGNDKVRRHIISHYNKEILKMFPSGKDCSICKKTFRSLSELAFHYAITHSMAKAVIPKEYMHIKNVVEFLKFENSPVVDLLVERLGWYEEVQQFDLGRKVMGSINRNIHFIVCQHCPKLLVGYVLQLKTHMIKHYSSEILKNFPNNDKCGICEKKFNNSHKDILSYHYGWVHGLAYKFVPEEDLQFTPISEVLHDDSEQKLLEQELAKTRALKKEKNTKSKVDMSKNRVKHESDLASSDDEYDSDKVDMDTINSKSDAQQDNRENHPPIIKVRAASGLTALSRKLCLPKDKKYKLYSKPHLLRFNDCKHCGILILGSINDLNRHLVAHYQESITEKYQSISDFLNEGTNESQSNRCHGELGNFNNVKLEPLAQDFDGILSDVKDPVVRELKNKDFVEHADVENHLKSLDLRQEKDDRRFSVFERNELMEDYAATFPLKSLCIYYAAQPCVNNRASGRGVENLNLVNSEENKENGRVLSGSLRETRGDENENIDKAIQSSNMNLSESEILKRRHILFERYGLMHKEKQAWRNEDETNREKGTTSSSG